MNCPLAEAFTKSPSVVYQNLLKKFWCTAIAYHLNPLTNDSEAHPLKEYLIKFLVMNGKKPLTLDFKTFTESTGLDYAKGKYVSHPSTEEVKAELAKIVDNLILLDGTPVLKTAFPVAWRILFTFVVDIGEIIYSDLVTRLTNKSRQKYVSYPRFVSCALEVLLGSEYTRDKSFGISLTILSNSNFSKDPSKVTPIELTAFMGFEASGSLPQKRKKLKSKKTPTETKVTPPTGPTEGSEQSHSVSSGNGTTTDPKDLGGNVQPTDKGLPYMASDEGMVKTTPLPEGPREDKDSKGLKAPANMEPLTNHVVDPLRTGAKYQWSWILKTFTDVQALLLFNDEIVQASDDEEVFVVVEEIDKDSPTPNKEQLEPSHTQESDSDSLSPKLKKYDNILLLTERQLVKYLRKVSRVLYNRITKDQWEKHEEAAVSYADLRASIEEYYEENVDHMNQTDKAIHATMDCLDKNSIERADLLKALNGVTKILKAVQDAVKENHALNKKVLEATEAYTANSNNITELLSLAKTFDLSGLKSLVESIKAVLDAQNDHLATLAKSFTSMAWNLGPRITPIKNSQAVIRFEVSSLRQDTSNIKASKCWGENVTQADTKEPPSYTEGEHVTMEDDTKKSELTKLKDQQEQLTDTVLKIQISDSGTEIELIGSSRPQPAETPTL
ncbi:hypothetical protein Tco_0686140 [Tanacetum coccineum]